MVRNNFEFLEYTSYKYIRYSFRFSEFCSMLRAIIIVFPGNCRTFRVNRIRYLYFLFIERIVTIYKLRFLLLMRNTNQQRMSDLIKHTHIKYT